jgi:hypothetical protein
MAVRPRSHSLDIGIIILVPFAIVCLCFTNNSQLALYETCKKEEKKRVNLEDRITSFRSCFHSSSVAMYNEREGAKKEKK